MSVCVSACTSVCVRFQAWGLCWWEGQQGRMMDHNGCSVGDWPRDVWPCRCVFSSWITLCIACLHLVGYLWSRTPFVLSLPNVCELGCDSVQININTSDISSFPLAKDNDRIMQLCEQKCKSVGTHSPHISESSCASALPLSWVTCVCMKVWPVVFACLWWIWQRLDLQMLRGSSSLCVCGWVCACRWCLFVLSLCTRNVCVTVCVTEVFNLTRCLWCITLIHEKALKQMIF